MQTFEVKKINKRIIPANWVCSKYHSMSSLLHTTTILSNIQRIARTHHSSTKLSVAGSHFWSLLFLLQEAKKHPRYAMLSYTDILYGTIAPPSSISFESMKTSSLQSQNVHFGLKCIILFNEILIYFSWKYKIAVQIT